MRPQPNRASLLHTSFLSLLLVVSSTTTSAEAKSAECSEMARLQDAADLEVFLVDRSIPTPNEVDIDGQDLNRALTSDYVLRIESIDHICLENLVLVSDSAHVPKILSLKAAPKGFIRITKVAFHGARSLLDLGATRSSSEIVSSEFSRAAACIEIRKDSRIIIRRSVIFECGIKKRGKNKKRPIRMKFVNSDIFLTTVDSLVSFLALPLRAGGERPQLIYKYNTFYVTNDNDMQLLRKMLERPNVRCFRNKVIVLESSERMKNRCVEVAGATEEEIQEFVQKSLDLGAVELGNWDLEQVIPPGRRIGGTNGAGEQSGEEEPSQPSGQPFGDGTLFDDGTGWRGPSTVMVCNGC